MNTPTPTYAVSGKVTLNGDGLGGVTVLLSGPSGTGSSNSPDTIRWNVYLILAKQWLLHAISHTGRRLLCLQAEIININSANVGSVNFTVTGQWQQVGSVPAIGIDALAIDPTNSQNIELESTGNTFSLPTAAPHGTPQAAGYRPALGTCRSAPWGIDPTRSFRTLI